MGVTPELYDLEGFAADAVSITPCELWARRQPGGYWVLEGQIAIDVQLPDGRKILGTKPFRVGALTQKGRRRRSAKE